MLQLEKERLKHFKINVKYDHIMLHKNTEKYLEVVCGVGSKIACYRIFGNSKDNFVVVKKGEK